MEKFNRDLNRWIIICLILLAFLVLVVFVKASAVSTNGVEASYGILSSTYTDTSAVTIVNGDVGFTTPPATAPLGVHTNYGSGAPYSTAGIDQGVTLALLNSQTCDFTFGSAQDLSLLVQPLTAGIYCVMGAMSVGTGGITLTSGTYIFRSTGALNTVANSIVSGGDSCDIFWTPVATTLGANSTFKGTVIDDAGITVGAVTTWSGRALSFGGTVTTDKDTITVPDCVTSSEDTTATTTPPEATTTPEVIPPVVVPVIGNGPIIGSYGVINTQPTTTPVIVPVATPVATSTTPKLPSTGYPPQKYDGVGMSGKG